MLGNQAATQLSRIKATINMQFRISLALLLPLSFWFGKFSFVSPLINLVAIPVVSLLVVPLCLLLIPMVFISSAVTGFIILIIDFIIGNLFLGLRLLQEAFPWDLLVGSVVSNSLVVVLAALGLILILMPLGGAFNSLGKTRVLIVCLREKCTSRLVEAILLAFFLN